MPARKTPVTQAELRRYLKAMREAGFEDGAVRIERDGTVSIKVGKAVEIDVPADEIDAMIDKVPNP